MASRIQCAMTDTLPKQAILIVNAMSRKGEAAYDEARE
jgi:hypothetical protein